MGSEGGPPPMRPSGWGDAADEESIKKRSRGEKAKGKNAEARGPSFDRVR